MQFHHNRRQSWGCFWWSYRFFHIACEKNLWIAGSGHQFYHFYYPNTPKSYRAALCVHHCYWLNATGQSHKEQTRVLCHRVICRAHVIDTGCGVSVLLDGCPDRWRGWNHGSIFGILEFRMLECLLHFRELGKNVLNEVISSNGKTQTTAYCQHTGTRIKPVSKPTHSCGPSMATRCHEHSLICLTGTMIMSVWRWCIGYLHFIYIVKHSEFASHQEHIWVSLSTCPNPQLSHITITLPLHAIAHKICSSQD